MYLFENLNDIKIPNVNISSISWPRDGLQRYGYTATYLPQTGEIIIIGGYNIIDRSKKPVDMKSVRNSILYHDISLNKY